MTHDPLSRRQFGATAGYAVAGLAFGGAALVGAPWLSLHGQTPGAAPGRLTARPRPGSPASPTPSTSLTSGPLGLGGERDGVVQMPSRAGAGPLPLMLLLHGATQTGSRMMTRISEAAEAAGVVIVAPDSRAGTWDAIRGDFGVDVAYLDRVLEHVFARVTIDPKRLAIAGFSDGASYALSLGLANGDLFPHVLAFSPGFVMRAPEHGKPRFFVSHGTADQILPIDVCSRVIVPTLRSRGFDVTFKEFEGRHELPPAIQADAFKWLLA